MVPGLMAISDGHYDRHAVVITYLGAPFALGSVSEAGRRIVGDPSRRLFGPSATSSLSAVRESQAEPMWPSES